MATTVSDKEQMDKIHLIIHSLRLIQNYKPSVAEQRINQLVIQSYSNECEECKSRGETLKNVKPQKSFFSKLGDAINSN